MTTIPEKLTTLDHVKEWANIRDNTTDALIERLIQSASQAILDYLNRSFAVVSYTDQFWGNGKNTTLLKNYPVVSVESVSGVTGSLLPQASGTPPRSGWFLKGSLTKQASLILFGYLYPENSLVEVSYTAGFKTDDTTTVVAATTYHPANARWIAPIDVTYNGVSLTQVASSPGALQYSVDTNGVYTWSDLDVGKAYVVTFSYAPADVEQSCIEIVALSMARRAHVGYQSKSLGGQETVSFSQADFPPSVKTTLNSYKDVIPL